MCGFAGLVNFKGISGFDDLDKKMQSALKRLFPRGPDQQDKWIDAKSYFVHSRLSILDTSLNGKQPMINYGKVIVYNGEIYNFKEIRVKLINEGYKFYSDSDCEVLLAGWDKWGKKILDYLIGMFSFAIWDIKKEKLFIIRDPYGKKPLYYSFINNGITFASDLKSLEKITDCSIVSSKALESFFTFRFIHDPLTIYENVNKLSPGHVLELSQNGSKIYQWYNLSNNQLDTFNKKDIKINIRNKFDKAVERRLVSDVPVGLLLSGGLDSSLVLSSLAYQDKKIPCFTMGFMNSSEYYEERPQAKRLANYFGMEHHNLEISSKSLLKIIPEVFSASDEPFADTSSLPFYALSKEVSKSVKVALSGDGGDEVFGGYRKYLGEKWAKLGLLIPNFIRYYISNLLVENKNTTYGELSRKIKRFLLNIDFDPLIRQINWLRLLNETDLKSLIGKSNNHYRKLFENYREGFDDQINSLLAGDMAISLSGDMLVKIDRMSMANSLEIRSPFLDKDLVEYAFSIPGSYKVGYFKGKKILRKNFSDRLPAWALNYPKKGFELPIADWLKNDLNSMVDHIALPKNLDKIGIENHALIKSWKEDLFFNNKDTSWKLWTLISYYHWCENRGIN